MNQPIIEEAILKKRLVEFTYSNHRREVEPHILGVSNGVLQLLGYQVGGSSSSGKPLPEWRRFDLNKITQLTISERTFLGPRPYPSGKHSPWDYQISVVKS